MTSISRERVELRQPTANLLLGPVLLAVILLAAVIRELFVHPPSMIIIGVCAGLAALDIALAGSSLSKIPSTLVVTAEDITFRAAANGMVGSSYTGYAVKLRDNATGQEVYAGALGRQKVQEACESQGWSFS